MNKPHSFRLSAPSAPGLDRQFIVVQQSAFDRLFSLFPTSLLKPLMEKVPTDYSIDEYGQYLTVCFWFSAI